MKRHLKSVIVVAASILLWQGLPASAQEDKTLSLNSLSMEVGALQMLFQLDFSKAQLEKLQQIAVGTAAQEPKRKPGKASKEYRDKLMALRQTLAGLQLKVEEVGGGARTEADSKSEKRIQKLNDELAAMRDKEKPSFDDRIEMTEPARKRAADAFRLLKPGQLAFYLVTIAGDIADPTERLIQTLEEVRAMPDEEWKGQRDEIADDIARLAAGLDAAKSKPVSAQISALLLRARGISKAEYPKQQADLRKSARKIIGEVSAMDVLRHHVELDLAALLSNPRLPQALRARLAAPQK